MLATVDASGPSARARIDQLFTPPRLAAAVSVTGWSPTTDGPAAPAWVVIAVGRGGLPALTAARRVAEDTHWTRIPPRGRSSFAPETASGLRAALAHGTKLCVTYATSPALYQRPGENQDPPLDGHANR